MCLVAAIKFGCAIKHMQLVRGATACGWVGPERGTRVVGAFYNYWKP
jgi:hypothetical protein